MTMNGNGPMKKHATAHPKDAPRKKKSKWGQRLFLVLWILSIVPTEQALASLIA